MVSPCLAAPRMQTVEWSRLMRAAATRSPTRSMQPTLSRSTVARWLRGVHVPVDASEGSRGFDQTRADHGRNRLQDARHDWTPDAVPSALALSTVAPNGP